ncbi:hypothetical protein [Campylobacter mucosalis]|uniref:hypothetical protein n=1 Tax=Campylobacter mucosalis TaxID=202 RepID=UPI0004D8CCC1|nr:hypothetical protein [Campylobacter mucosalis]KEA46127.1 membrane protein [Campylobacter mucosalis]QKF62577.1 outer membrane lipoprotein [Campylobacter mucosalis]
MRNFIIAVFMLIFSGCASSFCESCGQSGYPVDNDSKMLFEYVMTVKTDCSICDQSGSKVYIDGVSYRSDTALKCCFEKNMIDTDVGLKKVYFHRITDERESARSIYYTRVDGSKVVFNSNPRLEVLFYMFLEQELNSRAIVVVDTQTSPYTYRLDFAFNSLRGDYSRKDEHLAGFLTGNLSLSNINFSKKMQITTTQSVEKLQASRTGQFDFFVALLVKQAAIKVANEISKL